MHFENINPYLGLRNFEDKDSDIYSGNEGAAADLIKLIEENSVTLLTGFSGSGKTSFINAKFIPTLKGNETLNAKYGWEIIQIRPESDPFNQLNIKLRKSRSVQKSNDEMLIDNWFSANRIGKKRGLLIIDQFEELLTQGEISQSQKFIKKLLRLVRLNPYTSILISGRIDYLGGISKFEGLADYLTRSTLFLSKITESYLEQAIIKPAKNFGRDIEQNLVDLLKKKAFEIRDKNSLPNQEEEDDSLALLQYYLKSTWDKFGSFEKNKIFSDKQYLWICGPLEKVIDRCLDEVYYFSNNATRLERRMTKFLFQYLSKQDQANPKKIVRKPETLEYICNLYNSVFHGSNDPIFPTPLKDKKPTQNDWKILVKKYQDPQIDILKESNKKVDVVHETVFRQWFRCNKWIKEKNERFERFSELLNYEDKIMQTKRLIPYDQLEEFIKELNYFSSSLWRKEYYFYKGYNVKEKESEDKAISALKRLQRQRFLYAIKRSDFLKLSQILKYNKDHEKTNEQIFLDRDELIHGEFDLEFYYAIYPEKFDLEIYCDRYPKERERLRKANDELKNKFESASNKSKSKEREINWNKKDNIGQRWKGNNEEETLKIRQKLRDLLCLSPTDSSDHRYLFHYAALAGSKEYLDALLEFVYFPDKDPGIYKSNENLSAFGTSIYAGRKIVGDLAEIIYKKEVFDQINALTVKSRKGRTVLHYAVMSNGTEDIDWILAESGKKARKLKKIIKENSDSKNIENLKKQLESLENILMVKDENGNIPLHYVAHDNCEKISQKLLTEDQILSPNITQITPFQGSCILKSDKIINEFLSVAKKGNFLEDLLKIKADVFIDESNNYLLDVIRNISEPYQPDLNKKKYDILNLLLNNQDSEIADLICKQLNILFKDHYTLLHYCITWASFDIIQLLLSKGADPNIQDNNHWGFTTPLEGAVYRNDLNILKLFFENIKFKVRQETLDKAANYAFKNEKFEMYEFLLQQRATPYFSFERDYIRTEYREAKVNYPRGILKKCVNFSDTKWDIQPIVNSQWKLLERKEFELELSSQEDYLTKLKYESQPSFESIRITTLDFYPNLTLYEMKVSFPNIGKSSILTYFRENKTDEENIHRLIGKSPVIHELNSKLPINLNKNNVYEYLKFFCSAVHGEEGAFRIIENVEDIHWLDNKKKVKEKEVLSRVLEHCRNLNSNNQIINNLIVFNLLINYGNHLFIAKFQVDLSKRLIEMLEDTPIATDLSLKVEVFENNLRTYRAIKPDVENPIDIPFLYAASEGILPIMEWYAEQKNFDINKQTKEKSNKEETASEIGSGNKIFGKTALHFAVERKDEDIIEWLLKNGAKQNIEDSAGKTPADYLKSKDKKIQALLKKYKK